MYRLNRPESIMGSSSYDDSNVDTASAFDNTTSNGDLIRPSHLETETTGIGRSGQSPERVDVLYCLIFDGETDSRGRKFYNDRPWKGIKGGLPDEDSENESQGNSVLIYTVTVNGQTEKEGNTQTNWTKRPIDFDVKRDAVIRTTSWPKVTLCSKPLIDIMERLLDYYPSHVGSYDEFGSTVEDTIVEIMYFYHEMKAYFNQYVHSLPGGELSPELDIRSCGDEKYLHLIEKNLQFGSLDIEENPCDEATARDLAVLLRVFAPMYRAKVAPNWSSVFVDNEPRIKYDALWILLRPGTYVYIQESAFRDSIRNRQRRRERNADVLILDEPPDDTERVACVVTSWEYKKKLHRAQSIEESVDRLIIQVWYVQHNGHALLRTAREVIISRFDGFRLLSGLEIIPANLYDKYDGGALRRHLEKRGRRYCSILSEDVAHREYDHLEGGLFGQIIIDPMAYDQYALSGRFNRTQLNPMLPIIDGDGGERFRGLLDFQPNTSKDFPRIDEVHILCPRRIKGLLLKSKTWMNFEIDYVSDSPPKFSQNQMDNELVLVSDDDKDVLRAVLPKGEKPVGIGPDFIVGKGEGKIFLLYGPPGTGKTLTVECVANDTRRPLLTLTAPDLSISYHNSETELAKWFALAAKWDAILLIDEADLFLEQRRNGGIHSNMLTTVFLRTLEYYKGVLFLTTNRPGHIDDSFISRITSPIAYKALTPETKAKIVQKFIRKFEATGTIEMERGAATYLIDNCSNLNGRQLRNVLQNAVASAEVQQRQECTSAAGIGGQQSASFDMVTVRRHHVKTAVERQADFRLYLESLKGGRNEMMRAKSRQDYLSVAWNE